MEDIIYSNHKCVPCLTVKKFLEANKLDVKVLYYEDDFTLEEFRRIGLRSTPSMITESGDKIVNSQPIIEYLTKKYLTS